MRSHRRFVQSHRPCLDGASDSPSKIIGASTPVGELRPSLSVDFKDSNAAKVEDRVQIAFANRSRFFVQDMNQGQLKCCCSALND